MTEYNKNDFIESDNKKIEQVLKMLNDMGVTIQPANYSGSNKTPVLGLYTPDGNSIADISEISTNMEVLEDVVINLQNDVKELEERPTGLDRLIVNEDIALTTITSNRLVNDTITATQIANVNALGTSVSIGTNATATGNTAIAIGNSVAVSDTHSLAIGDRASATGGIRSTVVGSFASANTSSAVVLGNAAMVTGLSAIAIGTHASASSDIATAIGGRASATHDSSTIIVNSANNFHWTTTSLQILLGSSLQTPYSHRPLSVISDQRDKTDITDLKYSPLDFINAIEPKQYKLDFRSNYTRFEEITKEEYSKLDKYQQQHNVIDIPVYELNNKVKFIDYELSNQDNTVSSAKTDKFKTIIKSDVYLSREEAMRLVDNTVENIEEKVGTIKLLRVQLEKDGTFTNERLHNGFIAQQVKEVADAMGFDFTAFKDHSVNGGDDLYSLSYQEFIAPMVASIQELTKQNKMMMSILEKNDLI